MHAFTTAFLGLARRVRPGSTTRSAVFATLMAVVLAVPRFALAQGFDKVNQTVTNVNAILVIISVAVVTVAICWAGFKMIFQGSRLSEVANILMGGTLIGGSSAFAAFIVN
jgi:type IV secretion system protein VirB2